MEKLALYGGTPVRTMPMPNDRLGVMLYGTEELEQLTDVIRAQAPFRHYGPDPKQKPDKAAKLEALSRELLGVRYTLAVSSGSAALSCAMAAIDIGPGDEVIIPAFGWYSDYSAIVAAGATPVFAAIDDTLNLDPADFERSITPRTKAVIIIHYQGGPARIEEIATIARNRGILIVEDVAQAFGGSCRGSMLGAYGDVAVASFQYNKMLSCGEGGLFYTNDEAYFVRAVRYHDLGLVRPYFRDQLSHPELADDALSFAGNQYRLSELQAAVMIAQLGKLDGLLHACRSHYTQLERALSGLRFRLRPLEAGHCGITLFMRFQAAEEARRFSEALQAEGIGTGATSACRNMMHTPMVRNRAMPLRIMASAGAAEPDTAAIERDANTIRRTDEMLSTYVGISIGVLYTREDIEDIIQAVLKVHHHLYPAVSMSEPTSS